eukprot:SAG31_NODE_2677_length_5265_cov_15.265196_2_plen_83_part_00
MSTFDHDKRHLFVLAKPRGSPPSSNNILSANEDAAWHVLQISVDSAEVLRHPAIRSANGTSYGMGGLNDMSWLSHSPKANQR